MPLSVLAAVFENRDQSGRARWYGVGGTERYRRVPQGMLAAADLDLAISSVSAYASSSAENNVILFADPAARALLLPPWSLFPSKNYWGPFIQLSNGRGSRTRENFDLWATDINDVTRSMLVVASRRRPEYRMSFRDAFLSKWNSKLDDILVGTQARRRVNPTLTWEMFPNRVSHLDQDRIYLKIHQNLEIVIDDWPNYEASLTYHIYLYVNGAGNLRGYAARGAYWVESGIMAKRIGRKLKPKMLQGMDEINAELSSTLGAFDGLGMNSVYYLPGRQLGSPTPKVWEGNTMADVTIVVDF